MWFYYFIFFVLVLCHFTFPQKGKLSYQLGLLICLMLIIIAAFRPAGIDVDYFSYVKLFNDPNMTGGSVVEFSFHIISFIIKLFSSNYIYIFITYAFIGVGIKYLAIRRISEYWVLSLLIYFGYFYIYYDMTQIRQGAAMAFFLLSIHDIQYQDFRCYFIKFLLAISFHYSAIIMLPLYFAVFPNKKKIWPYLCALFISIILLFFNINYIMIFRQIIPVPGMRITIDFYIELLEKGIFAEINVFSFARIMRICIIAIMTVFIDKIEKYNKYARSLLKIYIISLIVFFLLANMPPVFSYRLSSFLGIVEIIIFTFFIYIIRQKIMGHFIVIGIGLIFLLHTLLVLRRIQPYF